MKDSTVFKSYIKTLSIYREIENKDRFHGVIHFKNVIENIKELGKKTGSDINMRCLEISVQWHDVGRLKTNKGHELESAELFKKYAKLCDEYSKEEIDIIYNSILNHNWKDKPQDMLGKLLQDADKLDFYSLDRLNIGTTEQIREVINLYTIVIEETLNFDCSKKLFHSKYLLALEKYKDII